MRKSVERMFRQESERVGKRVILWAIVTLLVCVALAVVQMKYREFLGESLNELVSIWLNFNEKDVLEDDVVVYFEEDSIINLGSDVCDFLRIHGQSICFIRVFLYR